LVYFADLVRNSSNFERIIINLNGFKHHIGLPQLPFGDLDSSILAFGLLKRSFCLPFYLIILKGRCYCRSLIDFSAQDNFSFGLKSVQVGLALI
jgi:hypothetical protein